MGEKSRKGLKLSIGIALVLILALSLLINAAAAPQAGGASVRVFVVFDRTPGPEERALVQREGGQVHFVYHIVSAISTTISEAGRDRLLSNPRVVAIEPVGTVQALDHSNVTNPEYPWGVAHIGSKTVHDGGNKGSAVPIAVIDTGVDYNHPDLSGRFGAVKGFNFVTNTNDPLDDNGHGTHVAGSVAATLNNTDVVGVAPEARLYALKILNEDGSGTWDAAIAAVQWALDNGVKITNNSYGSDVNPGGTVEAAFNNSYAAGVLHFASAGNRGNCAGSGDNIGWPAKFNSVIAVVATADNDQRPCFSSTGNDAELAAPGVDILSDRLGGGTTTASGTSMASPHAAGVGALVLACNCLTDEDRNGIINHVDARVRLQKTARDLGTTGKDPQYGYGLVYAPAAAPSGPPALAISNVSVSPSPFSPNGDAVKDTTTVSFGLNKAANWTVTVSDRSFTGSTTGAATLAVTWDGKNSAGVVVADGLYTISISATSGPETASASTSVTVDNTSPALSSIAAGNITSSSADITWSTNEASDSKVEYGTTSGVYTNSAYDGTMLTSHRVSLNPLNASTTYFYRVTSVDGAGNKAVSAEQSFTTTAVPSGNPNNMGVFAISWTSSKKSLDISVNIRRDSDASSNLTSADSVVSSAGVALRLILDSNRNGIFDCSAGDSCWNGTATTDSLGNVKFRLLNAPNGNYKAEVTGLTHPTYLWNKALDVDNPDFFTR